MEKHDQHILIVTGYSGAGKSSVLHTLEDMGYLCVDNLLLPLLDQFFQVVMSNNTDNRHVALGLDIRSGTHIEELVRQLHALSERWPGKVKIVCVVASPEVLLRRFQETRRKHPLSDEKSLSDAISYECKLLSPLSEIADIVLNTDQLTIHQLRVAIRTAFADPAKPLLTVNLISFGFKYGIPLESNFVFDVRSLPNPYFVPELKQFRGTDAAVHDYLFAHPEVRDYWQRMLEFIMYAVRNQEHKFFLTIAIGCTGGRHRSVALVHKLAQETIDRVHCVVKHRDIERDVYHDTPSVHKEKQWHTD